MLSNEDRLRLRLRTEYDAPGLLEVKDIIVKDGPQAWKTAAVLTFGDKTTGQVKRRTLRVQTWNRSPEGDFGFEKKADFHWSCDNSEIDSLATLLTAELSSAGTYALVKETSLAATILKLTADDTEAAAQAVVDLLAIPAVRRALADSGAARAGAAMISAQRQRTALDRLHDTIRDPSSSERALYEALLGEWWLFGGRFIGVHERRQFTSLDQLDIPLLRADGSLHVVELKRANIPKLIIPHRNHLVPGEEVHLAVGQAVNYLRALDEQAPLIRQDLGVDVRRASATVVIGHPSFCQRDEQEIAQTLRAYNSHLARIEVITYAELIAGATAALALGDSEEALGP